MPDENQKKRSKWKVTTWSDRVEIAAEAGKLESQLNALAAEDYEIYDVQHDRQLVIGRLDAPEGPVELQTPDIGSMLGQLFGRARPPEAPEQPTPEEQYTIQGVLTARLLNGIHAVAMVQGFGDPTGDLRLTKMIKDLFGHAPRVELERTLEDVKVFHERHQRTECPDPNCLTAQMMAKAKEKLEAQLGEKPLS